MKSCNQCGREIDDHAVLCPHCGNNQENAVTGADTASSGSVPVADTPKETAVPDTVTIASETTPVAKTETAPENSTSWSLPSQSADTDNNLMAETPAYTGMDFSNAPVEKKNKKLPLIIGIGVAAAAVIAVAVFLILQLIKTPEQKFVAYQQSFVVDNLLTRVESGAKSYNDYQAFSTDMRLSMEFEGNAMLQPYLDGTSIDLKINLEKNKLLGNLDLNLMGSPVLGGIFTYESGVAGFSIPAVDDNYYTLDLNKFMEEQGISGFGSMEIPEISGETLMKLGKLYNNVILGAVNAENLKEEKNADILLPEMGKTVKGDLYTFTPRAADLEKMFKDLATTIKNDQELRKFIQDIIGNNQYIMTLLEEEGNDFATLLDTTLNDAAEELDESAGELAKQMADSGFRWVIGVSENKIVYQCMDTKDGNGITYEAVGDGKNQSDAVISLQSEGYTEMKLSSSWKKDGNQITGSLNAVTEYSGSIKIDFDCDDSHKSILDVAYGSYSFTYDDGYDGIVTLDMEVKAAENGGTEHSFSINGLDEISYSMSGLETFKFTLHTSDEKSTAQEPGGEQVDLTDYTEEELEAFFDEYGEKFAQDIMKNLPSGILGY